MDAQRRRLCFRNERSLYTRKCDATGEAIISIYSPDKPFKVYKSDYWYGDNWDPFEYGQDFDFSKSFFEVDSCFYLMTFTFNLKQELLQIIFLAKPEKNLIISANVPHFAMLLRGTI